MGAMELTAENFETIISGNEVVLVDFWASWCGPCRQFAPIYEAAAQVNPDIVFASINTEEEQQLSAAAQITSIPTLMAFKQGELVFRQAGALPADALDQLITAVRELDVEAVKAAQAEAPEGDAE